MIKTIIFIWTLPQSLIGWIISLFCEEHRDFGRVTYHWGLKGAVSLGLFVMVDKEPSDFTVAHEYGHCKQSLYLGWLYLIVIGVPSFIWAALHVIGLFKNICYYDFYTEKWANRIAGYECYLKNGRTYYRQINGGQNE